jgi:uncharacterized protein YjbJ (UPF0337 family)
LFLPGAEVTSVDKSEQVKAQGRWQKLTGGIKRRIGRLFGNRRMEATGGANEVVGDTKVESAKSTDRVKGKIEEVGGAVEKGVGNVIGNEQMQVEGQVRELKGEARQELNK